jgi:hypothetical protein
VHFQQSLESDSISEDLKVAMLGGNDSHGTLTLGLANDDDAPVSSFVGWLSSFQRQGAAYFGGLSATLHFHELDFPLSDSGESASAMRPLAFEDRLPFYLWYAESGESRRMILSFESYSSSAIEATIETREPVLMQVHFDRLISYLRGHGQTGIAKDVESIAARVK